MWARADGQEVSSWCSCWRDRVTGRSGAERTYRGTPARTTGQRLWEEDSPPGVQAFLVLQLEESPYVRDVTD